MNTLEMLRSRTLLDLSDISTDEGRTLEHGKRNERRGIRASSVEPFEAERLTRMILPDVGVNILGKLGGLVAVRTLVFRRHAALVAQMSRHVFL